MDTLNKMLLVMNLLSYGTFLTGGNGNMLSYLGKNHRESCSDAEPCNGIKFLECKNNLCECVAPREIIYDKVNAQCAALAGYSCLRPIPGAVSQEAPKYQIACVPHAKCSYPEDICECEFRYYKTANHTCTKQRGFGERCSAEDQCDKYRFLSCIGGACTCDKNHRYDRKNGKCIVTVGAECKIINYLSISEEHYEDDECPEDASCRPEESNSGRGVCQCDPGFKLSVDKSCGRDYGDSCGVNRVCSDVQFVCRNGSCQCKYPMHQYYEEDTKRCVSLVGGPCDSPNLTEEPITGCTENAICQEGQPFNFCRCLPGYVETSDAKCVKAYGSTCEMDEECDPIPPLACIDNTCSCPDKLQVFDEKQRSCVSLAGGRCRKEMNSTTSVCTSNAYCVKSSAQLQYGRCICARGTTTTYSRICSKSK